MANGQTIAGFVTTQSRDDLPAGIVFSSLDQALSTFSADTVFVIASPPSAHFDQVSAVIKAGRDLFVEKPAFVSGEGAANALAQSRLRETIVVEAFMHRHTELYRRLLAWWQVERSRVTAIKIAFLIPALPAGSFRQNNAISSSSLYDIGSYALSLIVDLGLSLQSMSIKEVRFAGDCNKEALQLASVPAGISVTADVGVGDEYVNELSFVTTGGENVSFSPIFHGRPGEKAIVYKQQAEVHREIIRDDNAFQKMFQIPREIWFHGRALREKRIVEVTTTLERLGAELAFFRKTAAL